MKRGGNKERDKGGTNLPILKTSKGSPSSTPSSRGRINLNRSSDEIQKRVGLNLMPSSPVKDRSKSPGPSSPSKSPGPSSPSKSPGHGIRKSLSPSRVPVIKGGVRYITEDMIKKQAKEENMNLITNLNLNLVKETGKKIKYVENLERLRNLQILNISNNMVEKIEKMDKLLKLRELNLSYNLLTKIEGLEHLPLLQTLNLTGNQIQHIPLWFSKKLKSLRIFRISRNKLESLSEMAKLKALSDLCQFDVSENPLTELSHHRSYIIFHLRTLEIMDGQAVTLTERSEAQQRFAQDELEKVEHQLEEQETRNRHLEESHNKSVHELSVKDASASELRNKDKESKGKIMELEQELKVKEDLLKRKTSDLTKASEKHYQLEQELAFFKIDSKFESLGERPPASLNESGDDGGLIGESPYIGRAMYRSNQYAHETSVMSSPQKLTISNLNVSSPMSSPNKGFSPVTGKLHQNIDNKLVEKQKELELADRKLKALMDDLEWTEKKLIRATSEIKKMANRETPDHFKGDGKYKMRQRLARKMSNVTQLRDMATQVESEIDRKQQKLEEEKRQLGKIQEELGNIQKNSPQYTKKHSKMVDKEQQISESNEVYNDLKHQLDDMMNNIQQETQDIKKLEQQLRDDQIEKNEEMRQELDDVVSGLQVYIQNVKSEAEQQKQECEAIARERDNLDNKCKRLEQDLSILDTEATEIPLMQKKLQELEQSFQMSQDQNRSLSEQLNRRQPGGSQFNNERLDAAETEARNLRKTLVETERKSQSEKKFLEKQLQIEKERSERAAKKLKMSGSPDRDYRKVATQLEAIKAQNTSLVDELDGYRNSSETNKNTPVDDAFRPGDFKRRLKDLSKNFKSGKGPIRPTGEDDLLGKTFQDLQSHMQQELNKSLKEADVYRKDMDKADREIKTLKEQLKKNDNIVKRETPKTNLKNAAIMTGEDKEKKRLVEIIKHLERALKDAEQKARENRPMTKIVYSPGSESSDKASSLYSDEKELYDELQRELMELKRYMKGKAMDDEKRLVDAETEVSKWQSELQDKELAFEAEMEKQRQATDLLREKQEARIQVIAEDLENAQREADLLQQVLDAKDLQMQQDLDQVDLTNQITTTQEEELARLYDILTSQKNEIEKLNQMLDHLAVLGPDGVGAGFDDELWRVRQEVNSLKETLAMQSAYVQTMASTKPGVSFGTQADFIPPPVSSAPMYSKNPPQHTTPRQPVALNQDLPDATSSPNHPGRPSSILPQTYLESAHGPSGNTSSGILSANDPINILEMNSRPAVARPMTYAHNPVLPPKHNRFPKQMTSAQAIHDGPHDQAEWMSSGPIVPPPKSMPYPERLPQPVQDQPTFGRDFSLPAHPKKKPANYIQVPTKNGKTSRPASLPQFSGASMSMNPDNNQNQLIPNPKEMLERQRHNISHQQPFIPQSTQTGVHHPLSVGPHNPPASVQSYIPPAPANIGNINPGVQHNSRARRRLSLESQSAFEPVYRPAPYNPIQYALPPGVETSHMIPPHYGGGYPNRGQAFHNPHHSQQPVSTDIGQPVSYGPHIASTMPGVVDNGPRQGFAGGSAYMQGSQQVIPDGAHFPNVTFPTGYQPFQTVPQSIHPGPQPFQTVPQSIHPGPQPFQTVPQSIHTGTQHLQYNPNTTGLQQPYLHPQQISDNYVLTRQAFGSGVQPVAGPVPIGNHYYSPTGAAQQVGYIPNRVYYPATGDYPARFYYPIKKKKRHSRHRRSRSASLTPVASGTPVKGSRSGGVPYVVFEESLIDPPSPIRPVMESPPRGILKHANATTVVGSEDEEDSYLFCNVTEHHDLEDYIAELQEKLKSLKSKVTRFEEIEERRYAEEDSRLVHRLQGELEERRDELEGLDLAIERQKKNLKGMQREEKLLEKDRESAKIELKYIRKSNEKLSRKIRDKEDEEEEFDEFMGKNRQKYLKEEIECLEKTLTKRQGQFQDLERNLKECKNDLREAKEQARDTIEKYDTAQTNLQDTIRETNEIEKRANVAGAELVKLTEDVSIVKSELKKISHERSQQEVILKEINKIIKKKDTEYKELEIKTKNSTQSLQKLQLDLLSASEREKTMVDTLRDSDDLVNKRRLELNRMKDQFTKVKSAMAKKLESQKIDVESLNQEMGKTRTQLHLIQEDKDRKQSEFQHVLREADVQISNKHRELREEKDLLASVEQQKNEINNHIHTKRLEAQKLKDSIQEEEEVLQKLLNSVNKNKTELKHTYDMQQFEMTELENLKVQRSQKMAELEKTQRSLSEEKSELDNLTLEVNRKSSEVERIRQILERDRSEVDRLSMDKNTLQDRISALTREKDLMSDSCKNFDDKLSQMKRNHATMEEKIENTLRKLETLDNELEQREKELVEHNKQKSGITKEIQSLKHHCKESRLELKTVSENIKDAEDQLNTIDQDLRHKYQQRDEAKLEFDSLNDAIRQSRTLHEEMLRQEHSKRQELDVLLRRLYDHDLQYQEAKKNYNQIRQTTDTEESRLNLLINNANLELDNIRLDLTSKQEELNQTLNTVGELKNEADQIKSNEEKFTELEKQILELGKELEERDNEKTELANALTLSYEELQKVRKANAEEQERYIKERAILESSLQDIQLQHDLTRQDLCQVQERSDLQVGELITMATQHFHRANYLHKKLLDMRNSVEILNKIKPEDASENKENIIMTITDQPVTSFRDKWKKEAMKEKLVQEQDYLRYQLRQQMLRHAESMEKTRLASEETIEGLKRKLNNLQDVLFNSTENPDLIVLEQLTRSRSRSPPRSSQWLRRRTPSPVNRSSHIYRSPRRSRSGSPHLPEREFR